MFKKRRERREQRERAAELQREQRALLNQMQRRIDLRNLYANSIVNIPYYNIQCVLCLNELDDYDDKITLDCGHVFHLECLDNWIDRTNSCPVCRSQVF